jgi:hypothetical protein
MISKLSINNMLLVEIFNNKIYKIYDDMNLSVA